MYVFSIVNDQSARNDMPVTTWPSNILCLCTVLFNCHSSTTQIFI